MLSALLRSARPPFLILTPACIGLAWSLAVYHGFPINHFALALCLIGGLTSHISVNMLNEYTDFQSGLDLKTQRTPFSGGSGALPAAPEGARAVLLGGLAALIVTFSIGVYFALQFGWRIIPLGLIGMVIIAAYTPWINRFPLLCLLAPGLAFGPLMVVGTYFCLTGSFAMEAWLLSLIPFFLVNNLLLLNQFPDAQADREVGRNHAPIAYGLKTSACIYAAFSLAAVASLIAIVELTQLPNALLWVLPLFSLAILSAWAGFKYQGDIGRHPQFMASNVTLSLLMPSSLTVLLFIHH